MIKISNLTIFANSVFFSLLFFSLLVIKPAEVSAQCLQNTRADGLISTPAQGAFNKFGTSIGSCVISPNAAFANFQVPSYDALKSIYFNQSKVPASQKITDAGASSLASLNLNQDSLHYIPGNGTLNTGSSMPGGAGIGVIFIDGNLNITHDIRYQEGNPNSGLVFIVKGNINIDRNVRTIEAVLISEGIICTATTSSGTCPNTPPPPYENVTAPLVVNGSLISLNPDNKIIFRRSLPNNTVAAEQINQQAKYLVILRDLFSQTLSITTEDTNYSINL